MQHSILNRPSPRSVSAANVGGINFHPYKIGSWKLHGPLSDLFPTLASRQYSTFEWSVKASHMSLPLEWLILSHFSMWFHVLRYVVWPDSKGIFFNCYASAAVIVTNNIQLLKYSVSFVISAWNVSRFPNMWNLLKISKFQLSFKYATSISSSLMRGQFIARWRKLSLNTLSQGQTRQKLVRSKANALAVISKQTQNYRLATDQQNWPSPVSQPGFLVWACIFKKSCWRKNWSWTTIDTAVSSLIGQWKFWLEVRILLKIFWLDPFLV